MYYLKGTKFNASDADIEMYILAVVINVLPAKKNMSHPKHIHTFHGSINMSYRQWDVEQVINTQIYKFTVKILQKQYYESSLHIKNSPTE
jgi:hypothetical protein